MAHEARRIASLLETTGPVTCEFAKNRTFSVGCLLSVFGRLTSEPHGYIRSNPPTTLSDQPSPSHLDNVAKEPPPRLPRSVQAAYLRPLKRNFHLGVPSCDLQLRSYSVRNLEFFADFSMRAAYYLRLPAAGPIPLPRIVERWTVPRSNFVHKKSQENFERKTLRRLIQILDGHPDTISIWLAFLRKHAFHGVGMKANVWHYDKLDAGGELDKLASEADTSMADRWDLFGLAGNAKASLAEVLDRRRSSQTEDAPLQ